MSREGVIGLRQLGRGIANRAAERVINVPGCHLLRRWVRVVERSGRLERLAALQGALHGGLVPGARDGLVIGRHDGVRPVSWQAGIGVDVLEAAGVELGFDEFGVDRLLENRGVLPRQVPRLFGIVRQGTLAARHAFDRGVRRLLHALASLGQTGHLGLVVDASVPGGGIAAHLGIASDAPRESPGCFSGG